MKILNQQDLVHAEWRDTNAHLFTIPASGLSCANAVALTYCTLRSAPSAELIFNRIMVFLFINSLARIDAEGKNLTRLGYAADDFMHFNILFTTNAKNETVFFVTDALLICR